MLKVEHLVLCSHKIVNVRGMEMNKIWINPYGLWENESWDSHIHFMNQRRKMQYEQGKEWGWPSHSKHYSYALYMCICLCNMISSFIILQYIMGPLAHILDLEIWLLVG